MNHPTTPADDALFPVTRLTIAVPSVREFQRNYEKALLALPLDEVVALVARRAPWSEMEQLIANSAPYGFLICFKTDVHPVMQLAGDNVECIAYLMGNHIFAERMFRHDPRVMLYAPLHTVIWEDSAGAAWFSADQPSTQTSRRTIAPNNRRVRCWPSAGGRSSAEKSAARVPMSSAEGLGRAQTCFRGSARRDSGWKKLGTPNGRSTGVKAKICSNFGT